MSCALLSDSLHTRTVPGIQQAHNTSAGHQLDTYCGHQNRPRVQKALREHWLPVLPPLKVICICFKDVTTEAKIQHLMGQGCK